jgi:AAA ATPase domain/Adenylate and Guanylate cyclase catalytic domain
VMAVFGVPAVHEDDALRAVRAAQEMQEALPALGLEARIGINTGEVLVGDPEQDLGFVAGKAVIIAKRLEQGAATGEIVIGKATYPLIKHAVTAGPLERIPVKGKMEDVGRRRVDEVDLKAPGVARRLHAPIVGRDEELALLRSAFDRAVEERHCRVFTILGSAGIGKSRLVAEFCRSVGDVAITVTGRCLSYGEGITYWPLVEIVRDLGGEEWLRQALSDQADADVVAGLVRGAIRGSAEAGTPDQTFWAVRRVFERLAQERPLVVCIEDIHWAEPTFLDLVEYVAGWSTGAPFLVVCLARPELIELRPGWVAPGERADAIALEPLSRVEVGALLDSLSQADPLAPDKRERIALAAEGNPLFVEQIAAMASEEEGSGDGPAVDQCTAFRTPRPPHTPGTGRDRASIRHRARLPRERSRGALAPLRARFRRPPSLRARS